MLTICEQNVNNMNIIEIDMFEQGNCRIKSVEKGSMMLKLWIMYESNTLCNCYEIDRNGSNFIDMDQMYGEILCFQSMVKCFINLW